jgi:DNA-binding GntR family transcriptional regulator
VDTLQTKTLSETVGDELIRLIASGELKSGQRLHEVQLAKRFGVSRGPVREAARELEGQGLVISRPRQGFYIADFTAEQIVDLYEVVTWVDPAILRDFRTYSDPETCRDILADIENITRGDKLAFSNSLFEFRQKLAARIHNRVLAAQALALYRQFHIVTALLDGADHEAWMERVVTMLRAVWTAMANRDWDKAGEIAQESIEVWLREVAPRFRSEMSRETPR